MTAPSYTTDLTVIDDAQDETSWSELSSPWDASLSGPSDDTENYIADLSSGGTPQGISCTTTKTGIASMVANNGSGISWTTGDVFLVWVVYTSTKAMDSYANGGLRAVAGSGLSAFDSWDIGGKDRNPNPRGGWYNVAVDPQQTYDDRVGSPTTSPQYFGVAVLTTKGINKGFPFVTDAVRYGRAELIVEYGETADYATFAGMAAANDDDTARWGIFEGYETGYLWKGLMSLGTSTNAIDMRVPGGASISIQDCPKCYAAFNAIEINNAGSNIEWSGVVISALGTHSPGSFTMAANATTDMTLCTFKGMGAFVFGGTNTSITNSTWASCGDITAPGGTFTGCKILAPTTAVDGSAFTWSVTTNTDGYLDNMAFSIGANAHHAISFSNASASTYSLNGIDFSGFNASDSQNDSTFYVAATTGTVTITCTGCTGNLTYKSAGATVVVSSDVTVTFTGMKDNTEVRVYAAGTSTELDGIENATSGTQDNRSFAAVVAASTSVDYWIFAVGYLAIKVKAFSWPATAQSIAVQQVVDRNYSNP